MFEELLTPKENFFFSRGKYSYRYSNSKGQFMLDKTTNDIWEGYISVMNGTYANHSFDSHIQEIMQTYNMEWPKAKSFIRKGNKTFSNLEQAQMFYQEHFYDHGITGPEKLVRHAKYPWKICCKDFTQSSIDLVKEWNITSPTSISPIYVLNDWALQTYILNTVEHNASLEFKTKPQAVKELYNILKENLYLFYQKSNPKSYIQTKKILQSKHSQILPEEDWWVMFVKPDIDLNNIFK